MKSCIIIRNALESLYLVERSAKCSGCLISSMLSWLALVLSWACVAAIRQLGSAENEGSGYQLDKLSLGGFEEKDLPFLEDLVQSCIKGDEADTWCIDKGLKGKWKWRNKKWEVDTLPRLLVDHIKHKLNVNFFEFRMRAHFKGLDPQTDDVFITADEQQYHVDKPSLGGFQEKDIPFLEDLVNGCIENSEADRRCIEKGLNGKWWWNKKKWEVASYDSATSEQMKEVEFKQSEMRAHLKNLAFRSDKMDVLITAK